MTERLPSFEESPNQEIHDFLQNFAQAILRAAQESMDSMGAPSYPLDLLITYERKMDDLLAERDIKRGER